MRILIIIAFSLLTNFLSGQTFYDIKFKTRDGIEIKMSSFAGKKVLLSSVSPQILKGGKLAAIDSLLSAYQSLVIVIVPADDWGGQNNSQTVGSVQAPSSQRLFIAELASVKKANSSGQSELMKWLTNSSLNGHYDADVNTDDQIYVVSESGVLYSVLEKGVPRKVVGDVLKQTDK